MDPRAAFFLLVLALQAAFTAALILLVARRYPARARAYRFVAPAAVPVLLFAFVALNFVAAYRAQGLTPDAAPLLRIAAAYLVLWLAGVLLATLLLRLVRR